MRSAAPIQTQPTTTKRCRRSSWSSQVQYARSHGSEQVEKETRPTLFYMCSSHFPLLGAEEARPLPSTAAHETPWQRLRAAARQKGPAISRIPINLWQPPPQTLFLSFFLSFSVFEKTSPISTDQHKNTQQEPNKS